MEKVQAMAEQVEIKAKVVQTEVKALVLRHKKALEERECELLWKVSLNLKKKPKMPRQKRLFPSQHQHGILKSCKSSVSSELTFTFHVNRRPQNIIQKTHVCVNKA